MGNRKPAKFKSTMYVDAYVCARDGLTIAATARKLNISKDSLVYWVGTKPILADALNKGRQHRKAATPKADKDQTFYEYIYDQLTPKLKAVWDEINELHKIPGGVELVEAALERQGTRTRQHLFIYSMTKSNYSMSKSLKVVNICRGVYNQWKRHDPDFAALVEEIFYYKHNFFEDALIGRVAAGDTQAIIHVAKTALAHRGYNDKLQIEHTGTINHAHTIDVEALDLPVATLKTLLAATRAHKAKSIDTTATPVQRAIA